jgi:hypothetical protein
VKCWIVYELETKKAPADEAPLKMCGEKLTPRSFSWPLF